MTNQMPRNAQGAQQLRDQLNRAAALGNEPWKVDRNDWNELHQGIARALQDAQMGIRNQLQQTIQKEKLFMARDEEVPPQYRDIVNKYYEKLSKDVQK
jgi:hypothetical protein